MTTNTMTIPNDLDEDVDFSDIEKKYQVRLEDGFDNILVVDGVPVIDRSRLERLLTKIAKEFTRKGAAIKPADISVPWNDETGKSNGYAFIEFRNADTATHALNEMNGHPFDAKHTFFVNRFTDIEKFADMDETYVEPEREEYLAKEHLRAWLADSLGRDQCVTYRGDEVSIHWHGRPSQCEVAYEDHQNLRTELYVSWSPLGTYIATLHRQGVRLYGGPSFQLQARFFHPLVRLIDFSPCEQYLVTWSHEPIVVAAEDMPQGPRFFSAEDEGNNIAVWDIKTGHLLRTFPSIVPEGEGPRKQMAWPALKWSADDKYTARLTPGQQISVYELPGMGLQGRKSLKIEGVTDFEWCPHGEGDLEDPAKSSKKPTENMLVYWTPEVANQPARVTLINFPARTVLCQKNLFHVSECRLYWQNRGDFLCVRVDRHTKTKKSMFCNLEIFRVREKDFPVEVVELKDTVTDFSWEPKGERFAIVSSSDPNLGGPGAGVTIKTDVSFYQLDHSKNDFRLLRTLAGRTTNTIRWSPRGRHVVLATVGSTSKSELEFWDLDFNFDDIKKDASKDEWAAGIQQLGMADHYGVTDVEWDPSGRYLATAASAWTHTIENGYAIWDFRGQEIEKRLLDRFKQFLWRPRPPSLLTNKQKQKIRKNLREYSRAFEEADAAEETTVSAELVAQRKRAVDEWNAWRVRVAEEVTEARRARGRRGEASGREEEEDKEEIEVWIDELIEQTEEVVE